MGALSIRDQSSNHSLEARRAGSHCDVQGPRRQVFPRHTCDLSFAFDVQDEGLPEIQGVHVGKGVGAFASKTLVRMQRCNDGDVAGQFLFDFAVVA